MLSFGVYTSEMKRLKTLKTKQINTIYNNYNKYCKRKGYIHLVPNKYSFGYSAWQNLQGQQLLLVREGSVDLKRT